MKDYEWIFQALIALGTFLAVLVALFGDWAKNKWFKPKLSLRLLSRLGTRQRTAVGAPERDGGGTRIADARYYHLQVSNAKRWPPATHVQVHLLQIEELGPDRSLRVAWCGDLPLIWQHQQIYPLARTIGADAACDFFCVLEHKWVSLQTVITPIGFDFAQRRQPFSGVVFTVQARSLEVDTVPRRYRVSWDGQWAEGEVEMSRHFVIEELETPAF